MDTAAGDRSTLLDRLLALLAVAYFAAVAVWNFGPDVHASADAVGDGRVWLLLSSALDVQGDLPALQLALGIALAAWVIARAGARLWWLAALTGHVGSALIAYGMIGIAAALGSASAERASDDPDYGVSCVVAGSLGALFATGLVARRGAAAPDDPPPAAAAASPSRSPADHETAFDVHSRRRTQPRFGRPDETAFDVRSRRQMQLGSDGEGGPPAKMGGAGAGDWAAVAVGAVGLVAMIPVSLDWYGSEHVFAFAIAAAVGWRFTRAGVRRGRGGR